MKSRSSFTLIILLAAFILTMPAPASAQTVRSLTLAQCLDSARLHNPSLNMGRLEIRKSQALEGTSFDVPNTEVSLSQDPSSGGSPDNSVTLSQSFEFPTVISARRKLLCAETDLQHSNLGVTERELLREITTAYYTLVYADKVASIYRDLEPVYIRFVNTARARQETGEGGQLECINAERAERQNMLALRRAESDRRTAALSLRQLMGTSYDVVPTDTLTATYTILTDSTISLSHTPWGRQLESRRTVAEHSLRLARQSFMPQLSVALRAQALIKGFNPYNVERDRFKGNFMGFEVGIGIPLFYKAKRARIQAAKADIELENERYRQTEQLLQRQYAEMRATYRKAAHKTAYYISEGLPEAIRMADIANIAYEKGEIGYIEYMQNLETTAEVRLQTASALLELNLVTAAMHYLQDE